MGSIHDLRPDAFNYVWDNSIEPALEIESGEAVELHVRDASDEQIHKGSGVEDVAKLDFSHVNPVSGPVFVKGARAGDVLEVELLEFKAKDWGWTAIIPGFGLLAEEFPEPWLRISEVDAASERVRFGGNMDVKHLRAGVKLFLPVGVDGALFSLGDTHAAQGDGEVCGTAIEAAMDVVLRLSVRSDLSILAPQFHLPKGALAADEGSSFHVCTGVGPDLMEAARDAVRATIAHLGEHRGLEREEAYALASVVADLRIHEVVDAPNWVVGAFMPEQIFEEGGGR